MTRTLLVAEPDEMLTDLYTRYFAVHGYTVESVSGGVECVVRLRQSAPDVLLLNMELPWGGGDGVLAQIREEFEHASAPTVIVTSDESEPAQPPVVKCFQKPF